MMRAHALLVACFVTSCGDQQHGVVLAPVNAGVSADLHVGDYIVYRFSGSYTSSPITLREQVTALEGGRVTLDVRATRGHEERHWIQVGPDSAEARWNDTVDEIYVVGDHGAKQRLPNPDNQTLARLYEWVIVDADGEATSHETAACEQAIASARIACTCDRATRVHERMTVRSEESRCVGFAWQRGPARWVSVDGQVVWQVDVVETSPNTSPAR